MHCKCTENFLRYYKGPVKGPTLELFRMPELMKPINVQPRKGYTIWLRYENGVSGEIDLSDFANRSVFKAWADRSLFESVHLSPYRGISWPGDLDLCADMLYMRLTDLP